MYLQLLTISVLALSCYGYEEEDLRQALGGGLAEGLDDLMTSFGEAIDNLAEMAEGKSVECKYKCENGKKPEINPNHIPKSNGCGTFGIEFDTAKLPEMTDCCDVHDKCYDTCNEKKDECDTTFKHCLYDMCSRMNTDLNEEEYEGCQATAELMYRGTLALGCTPYKKAQKKACHCGDIGLEYKPGDTKNKSGIKKSKVTKSDDKIIDSSEKPSKSKKSKKVATEEKTQQKTSRQSGEL